MPIEIRELHIKATISHESGPVQTGVAEPESNQTIDQEALIAECVAQVLQILNDKAER